MSAPGQGGAGQAAVGVSAAGTAATYQVSGRSGQSRQTVVSWYPLKSRRALEYLNPALKAGQDGSPLAQFCSRLPSLTWRPGAPGGPGGPGAPGGPCNTPKHKWREAGGGGEGEVVAGGGGRRAQSSGSSTHLWARLRLPGHPGPESWGSLGPREGEERSAGAKQSRGMPTGARGAYRHAGVTGVLAGTGWAGTFPGVSLQREEVRAGRVLGRHGGHSSTPTPAHLLALGTLLPLRGEKPEMCISRQPPTPSR